MFKTIEWTDEGVVMIDQRKLPSQEVYPVLKTYGEVAHAIKEMVIRGAPAIGVAAAMGIALGARQIKTENPEEFEKIFFNICETFAETRPTAVNLFWAITRMKQVYLKLKETGLRSIVAALKNEALHIQKEDVLLNRMMGSHGANLIKDQDCVLTHCNAGALATAGYGTALGVVRSAVEQGKTLTKEFLRR